MASRYVSCMHDMFARAKKEGSIEDAGVFWALYALCLKDIDSSDERVDDDMRKYKAERELFKLHWPDEFFGGVCPDDEYIPQLRFMEEKAWREKHISREEFRKLWSETKGQIPGPFPTTAHRKFLWERSLWIRIWGLSAGPFPGVLPDKAAATIIPEAECNIGVSSTTVKPETESTANLWSITSTPSQYQIGEGQEFSEDNSDKESDYTTVHSNDASQEKDHKSQSRHLSDDDTLMDNLTESHAESTPSRTHKTQEGVDTDAVPEPYIIPAQLSNFQSVTVDDRADDNEMYSPREQCLDQASKLYYKPNTVFADDDPSEDDDEAIQKQLRISSNSIPLDPRRNSGPSADTLVDSTPVLPPVSLSESIPRPVQDYDRHVSGHASPSRHPSFGSIVDPRCLPVYPTSSVNDLTQSYLQVNEKSPAPPRQPMVGILNERDGWQVDLAIDALEKRCFQGSDEPNKNQNPCLPLKNDENLRTVENDLNEIQQRVSALRNQNSNEVDNQEKHVPRWTPINKDIQGGNNGYSFGGFGALKRKIGESLPGMLGRTASQQKYVSPYFRRGPPPTIPPLSRDGNRSPPDIDRGSALNHASNGSTQPRSHQQERRFSLPASKTEFKDIWEAFHTSIEPGESSHSGQARAINLDVGPLGDLLNNPLLDADTFFNSLMNDAAESQEPTAKPGSFWDSVLSAGDPFAPEAASTPRSGRIPVIRDGSPVRSRKPLPPRGPPMTILTMPENTRAGKGKSVNRDLSAIYEHGSSNGREGARPPNPGLAQEQAARYANRVANKVESRLLMISGRKKRNHEHRLAAFKQRRAQATDARNCKAVAPRAQQQRSLPIFNPTQSVTNTTQKQVPCSSATSVARAQEQQLEFQSGVEVGHQRMVSSDPDATLPPCPPAVSWAPNINVRSPSREPHCVSETQHSSHLRDSIHLDAPVETSGYPRVISRFPPPLRAPTQSTINDNARGGQSESQTNATVLGQNQSPSLVSEKRPFPSPVQISNGILVRQPHLVAEGSFLELIAKDPANLNSLSKGLRCRLHMKLSEEGVQQMLIRVSAIDECVVQDVERANRAGFLMERWANVPASCVWTEIADAMSALTKDISRMEVDEDADSENEEEDENFDPIECISDSEDPGQDDANETSDVVMADQTQSPLVPKPAKVSHQSPNTSQISDTQPTAPCDPYTAQLGKVVSMKKMKAIRDKYRARYPEEFVYIPRQPKFRDIGIEDKDYWHAKKEGKSITF